VAATDRQGSPLRGMVVFSTRPTSWKNHVCDFADAILEVSQLLYPHSELRCSPFPENTRIRSECSGLQRALNFTHNRGMPELTSWQCLNRSDVPNEFGQYAMKNARLRQLNTLLAPGHKRNPDPWGGFTGCIGKRGQYCSPKMSGLRARGTLSCAITPRPTS